MFLKRLKKIVNQNLLPISFILAICFPRDVCENDSHLLPRNVTRPVLAKVSRALPNEMAHYNRLTLHLFQAISPKGCEGGYFTCKLKKNPISSRLFRRASLAKFLSDTTWIFLGGSACGDQSKKWIFRNKRGQHFDVTFISY